MRSKIIFSYIAVVAIITAAIGFLAVKRSQEAHLDDEVEKISFALEAVYTLIDLREDLMQERVNNNLNIAERLLEEMGPTRLEMDETDTIGAYLIPALYAGNTKLSLNFNFVDQISKLVGGQATVFVLHNNEFVRVSTNVMMEDGNRAVGTSIRFDSPVYQTLINKNPYRSRSLVIDVWYVTAYKPVFDAEERVIGVLAVGKPELDDKFSNILANAKFGQKGYVYLVDSSGEIIYHPTHRGKNLKDYGYFNEILGKDRGTLYYTFSGSERLASFRYFEPWDWYIISSANIDEIKSYIQGIVNTLITVMLVVFVIIMALFVNQKMTNIKNKKQSSTD